MNPFYFTEIRITGPGVKDAIIHLRNGLNIIVGPSNTGKSYISNCLDFIFGLDKEKFRIETDTGYNRLIIKVNSGNGNITLERGFEDSIIEVSSSNPVIKNGSYKTGTINDNNEEEHINRVWLGLMNITDPPKIISNQNAERQRFTFRSILHSFFIEENRILQLDSILLHSQRKSASVTAIYYLLTGESFKHIETQEKKNITEAKLVALKDYLNSELNHTAQRKSELGQSPFEDREIIIAEINKRLNELSSYESTLTRAINRNREISTQLTGTYDKVAETDMLFARYQNLRTQYISDIHRLNFVIEGEINVDSYSPPTKCPFCAGEIEHQKQESCASAASGEINLIRAKISDLEHAEESIIEEKNKLQEEADNLENEKNDYLAYIESDLQPKVTALRQNLSSYKEALKEQNEFQFMATQEGRLIVKISEIEAENDSRVAFKPKEYYDGELLDDINNTLEEVIYHRPVNQIGNVYFSLKKFDIVANGKDKQTFGKGYRAFFNTVVGLTFMRLLSTQGAYSPGLFIVDSPILSLKEQGEEKASNSMKTQLFQYMVNNQGYGQMIVIENEIPDIDYKGTNIIEFTKKENEGRYGLLHGVKN